MAKELGINQFAIEDIWKIWFDRVKNAFTIVIPFPLNLDSIV